MASAFVKLQTQDQDLTRVQQNIANAINPLLSGPSWTPLVLNAPWVNSPAGFNPQASYILTASGEVWLSGWVTSTTMSPGGFSAATFIAQLPQSLCPAYELVFPAIGDFAGVASVFRVDIKSTGQIYCVHVTPAGSPPQIPSLSLDGIRYIANNT